MPPAAQLDVVRRCPAALGRDGQDELGTVIAKWIAVHAPGRAGSGARIPLDDVRVGGGRVVLRYLLDRVPGAGRRPRTSRIETACLRAGLRAGLLDRIGGDHGRCGPVEQLGAVPACAAPAAG